VEIFLILTMAGMVQAQTVASVQDPDGWTNLRADGTRSAKVLRRIDHGTKMLVHTSQPQDGWHHVTTLDGQSGYVHSTRIKIQPSATLPIMVYDERSVTGIVRNNSTEYGTEGEGRREAQRYLESVMAGYRNKGTVNGLQRILSPGTIIDGAIAEGHDQVVWAVLHGWGDEAFALAVGGLSPDERTGIAEAFGTKGGETNLPIEKPKAYLTRFFPRSYGALTQP
jgi:hypothetical protein